MSDLLKKIEHDALSLSHQERAFLADRFLSSLDDNVLNDIEAEWIAEAGHRDQDFNEVNYKAISAHEVFDQEDRILK